MRNLKKFLALVLAMMMAFSLMVTANAKNPNQDYPDISDATFTEAIDVLTGMGVFRGDNGNFKPSASIMRCEAVAVLYRLVTGDVTDSQKDLYAPAAKFADVPANAWFAGYVGFAVDAGLVKGYDGNFMPYKNVTGYEMLAMLLRAVGYGKNGEFTGSQWMVNVGSRAQALGILNSIKSTHYANTLSQPSAREVVAELTFTTAKDVPQVTWTQLGGYNEYPTILQSGDKKNPTLGAAKFGLTDTTGIIVGNQETGEDKTHVAITGNTIKYKDNGNAAETKVADTYAYAQIGTVINNTNITEGNNANGDAVVTTGLKLDIKTGLELYGHKVKAWHNGKGHAFAVVDQAKSATVYASGDTDTTGDGKIGKAAKAAGLKPADAVTDVYWSTEYSGFAKETGTDFNTESAIKMYNVIDNTGDGKIDAVIRLNAEVAKVTVTKTTAVPQVIEMKQTGGNKADSEFTSAGKTGGAASTLIVSGDDDQVIGDFDIKTALGKIFTVWQVVGNDTAASGSANTPANTDMFVLKTPLQTVTGTVSTYKHTGGTVTTVNAIINGEAKTIDRSGILEGSKAIAYYDDAGPDTSEINAGVTYTFTLDEAGRFVAITAPNEYTFLYTTYADFQYGALGTGEIEYFGYGVDWDGKLVTGTKLTGMHFGNGNEYPRTSPDKKTLGDGYVSADLGTTKKDMATNSVKPGVNKGFMISKDGDMIEGGDGDKMVDGASWPVDSTNAANGFAKVTNGSTDYMLTNDTEFYVVTGFGVNASVKVYKGLKDLLGAGTSAVISYADGGDEVWFQTGDYKFDSVTTTQNNTVSKVILADTNLRSYAAQNLYFVKSGTEENGVMMAGSEAKQVDLWLNGVKGSYWIVDNNTNTKDYDVLKTACASENVFVTLSQKETKNGVPIYEVEVLDDTTSPKDDVVNNGGACNSSGLQYQYIMVNNYNKAQIGTEILNVDGAVVADVEYDAGGVDTRIEIDSVQKLNNAVSTSYNVQVAIVNDGINVKTIYVLSVS